MAIQLDSDDLKAAVILAAVAAGGRGGRGIPTGALGGATGGIGGTTGMLSGIGGNGKRVDHSDLRMYEASEYPKKFTPNKYHEYDVVLEGTALPGGTNALSDTGLIKKDGRMQTLEEHNDALLRYVRPGMNPREMHVAIANGQEYEKTLPQFWDESDSNNNHRAKFSVHSSAVSGIRITPDGYVQVKWAKPSKKNPSGWYTFKQYPNTYEAALAAQRLMMEPSIGRAVYPVITNPMKINLDKRKTSKAKGPLGEWNQKEFNTAFSPAFDYKY